MGSFWAQNGTFGLSEGMSQHIWTQFGYKLKYMGSVTVREEQASLGTVTALRNRHNWAQSWQ